jgi:transcriptional regulator with XRE-family HTH domain
MVTVDDDLPRQDAEPLNSKRANSIDTHIGNRVRLRRMLLGMSQERLGELLKVTFQQVQKYERGTNRVSASRLFELAKVLGVSIDYFYDTLIARTEPQISGFAEPTDDEAAMLGFLATREGIELNRAFMRITDPARRRAVVELVRSMAGEEAK